ncbi:MAG: hypothetical protein KA796_12935 [Chryseobacterium sp.]|nr:hypothetical protein [Chryseobacterium sp.]MBP7500752.1 hypothetical protein [Chryseobacterium sp.]
MKEYTVKNLSYSVFQVFDENEKKLGEILHNLINGYKEKIKINNEIFRIENTGFLWSEIKIYDNYEKLIIKSDSSKSRLVYFGDETEIYTYKSNGWMSSKVDLYKKNQILISIKTKGIFKYKYEIKVNSDFKNDLLILTFLNLAIRFSGNNG